MNMAKEGKVGTKQRRLENKRGGFKTQTDKDSVLYERFLFSA